MNNSKMWLVVKPTVGIPLFLSAVAVGSFAVHVAVLSNTTWVADFLSGQELGAGMESASMMPLDGTNVPATVAHITSDHQLGAGQEILITLPDGTTATAILQAPAVMASTSQNLLPQVTQ